MRRVLTALLVLVGLVPATLHAAPTTYAVVDVPTNLARSYVGARYYVSRRFITVDPMMGTQTALFDP